MFQETFNRSLLLADPEDIYVVTNKKYKFLVMGAVILVEPEENPGKTPLEIIEVQMGDYLEEDDIVRFDDEYGRV